MEPSAENADDLVLIVFGVVNRVWGSVWRALHEMLEWQVVDDLEAKAQFTVAVLALALGEHRTDAFLERAHAGVAQIAPDLAERLRHYDAIRSAWPNLNWDSIGCRFELPPLKHPHELIAIQVMDHIEVGNAVELRSKKCYNLYDVELFGGAILSTAIEARKLFLSQLR